VLPVVAVDLPAEPEPLPDEPEEPPLAALAPPASTVMIAAVRIHPPMALPSPMTDPPSRALLGGYP
jgi:hypothetical protein